MAELTVNDNSCIAIEPLLWDGDTGLSQHLQLKLTKSCVPSFPFRKLARREPGS